MTGNKPESQLRIASATIKDVARLAAVSLGSVLRVLDDTVPVTADVRAKVLSAIEELAYQTNTVTHSMRSHVARTTFSWRWATLSCCPTPFKH